MKYLKILCCMFVLSIYAASNALAGVYRVGDVISDDYIGENIRVYSHRKGILSNSQKKNLKSIPGIMSVSFDKYKTTVFKSKIYTWEEILGAIFFILNEGR